MHASAEGLCLGIARLGEYFETSLTRRGGPRWKVLLLRLEHGNPREDTQMHENTCCCSVGDGSYGQLGKCRGTFDQATYTSSVPVQVLGNHSFVDVCTAYQHSCALDSASKAWCWGANEHGQFGAETTSAQTCRPKSLAATLVTPSRVIGKHAPWMKRTKRGARVRMLWSADLAGRKLPGLLH